jgi:hypothetical protein
MAATNDLKINSGDHKPSNTPAHHPKPPLVIESAQHPHPPRRNNNMDNSPDKNIRPSPPPRGKRSRSPSRRKHITPGEKGMQG